MSSRAIGCVGVESQRGATITGSRSTRATIVSNAALPRPTMTAARSVVTGTAPDASTAAVSIRLRRWAESWGWSSPSPPR